MSAEENRSLQPKSNFMATKTAGEFESCTSFVPAAGKSHRSEYQVGLATRINPNLQMGEKMKMCLCIGNRVNVCARTSDTLIM